MKRHDNTLFVTTQKSYLSKNGTNVVVSVKKKELFRAPIHTFGQITCFGNVSCSPFLMGFCGEEGVGLSFHTMQGRFLSRAVGPQSGNVLLRRSQHKVSSNKKECVKVSKTFISAKLLNSRTVLQRATRDYGDSLSPEVTTVIGRLSSLIRELQVADNLEVIRGIEGDGANMYFGVLSELVVAQKEDFYFNVRSRRPPLDNLNALLSFIYTLLSNDMKSACESVGLDPQMGFLHADRPGRASLALDLVEEFRSFIGDRLALSLINRMQITGKGFNKQESGAVEMDDKTRKVLLTAYQKRKEDELMHPFLKEKVSIGLLPFIQARLLARWLRGDLDAYPAFFYK